MNSGSNTMAQVSVATGAASLLGSGCCCLPLVSYIAMAIVPPLAIAAIVTGVMAQSSAAEHGGGGMAKLGIGLGIATFVLDIGMVALSVFMGVGFVSLIAILGSM